MAGIQLDPHCVARMRERGLDRSVVEWVAGNYQTDVPSKHQPDRRVLTATLPGAQSRVSIVVIDGTDPLYVISAWRCD
jgi:hypothetical protein